MHAPNISKSKKIITSQTLASKILQQESERQSDDFLHLFVGGGIKANDLKNRVESKITTWDYQGKSTKVMKQNSNEKPSNQSHFFRSNHISNTKIKSKGLLEKLYTQTPESRPNHYNKQQKIHVSKNSFSISLLNSNLQEIHLYYSPQRNNKSKPRVLKNYFLQNFSAKYKDKLRKLSNKKAKTQALDIINEEEKISPKVSDNLGESSYQSESKKFSCYQRCSKMNPFHHNKRKSFNYFEQSAYKKQLRISQRHNAQVLKLINQSNIKFKQSLQFQKLKNLLTLQKI